MALWLSWQSWSTRCRLTVNHRLTEMTDIGMQVIDNTRANPNAINPYSGILITNAHQVKGLEFSGVIIWNPTQKSYPETELGKNLLYVAITRASDRLAIYHHAPLSRLFSK